jgi:hypothetical protein
MIENTSANMAAQHMTENTSVNMAAQRMTYRVLIKIQTLLGRGT